MDIAWDNVGLCDTPHGLGLSSLQFYDLTANADGPKWQPIVVDSCGA